MDRVRDRSFRVRILPLLLICLSSGAPTLWACSVPVFRYALERWDPDAYQALLVHRGALAPDEKKILEWLQKCASDDALRCNLEASELDLATAPAEAAKEQGDLPPASDLPCLILRYPNSRPMEGKVCWQGRLTADVAKSLVDSPARREVARRILGGDSAVWVLLEGGKREANDAAAKVLEAELKKANQTLKLPEKDPDAPEAPPEMEAKLRIAFSWLRVSRADPAEAMLVQMLVGVEPDLAQITDKPMAFPIFGRGRALFALVGDGIKDENIQEACEFLIGACSCQVKAACPGVDLVMSVAWEAALTGQRLTEPELPPLTGLSAMAAAARTEGDKGKSGANDECRMTNDESKPKAEGPAAPSNSSSAVSPVVRNALLAVAVGLSVLGVAGLWLWVRNRRLRAENPE